MSTYNQLLRQYKKAFETADIPLMTIKFLLNELCNEWDINLYTALDEQADQELEAIFHEDIKRLLKGEPLDYVLGYCWFYGYKLKVNPDVLIPRYETEELVLEILKRLDESPNKDLTLADIGCGSGAIAIALKKECPSLKVYATDISLPALNVASDNAHELDCDITFYAGDLLEPLIERQIKVDYLISNPPYIPDDEVIDHSVKDFEPHIALFGGEGGITYYQRMAERLPLVLKEGATVAFEIGWQQKQILTELFAKAFSQSAISCLKDLNGKDRMLFIKML